MIYVQLSRWWFQRFLFWPLLGEMIQFDEHIFIYFLKFNVRKRMNKESLDLDAEGRCKLTIHQWRAIHWKGIKRYRALLRQIYDKMRFPCLNQELLQCYMYKLQLTYNLQQSWNTTIILTNLQCTSSKYHLASYSVEYFQCFPLQIRTSEIHPVSIRPRER